jgi:hypothetical protein
MGNIVGGKMGIVTDIQRIVHLDLSRRRSWKYTWGGPIRLSKLIRRDAVRAKKIRHNIANLLNTFRNQSNELNREKDSKKRKEITAKLLKTGLELTKRTKKEIDYLVDLAVNDESLLYYEKEQLINTLQKEYGKLSKRLQQHLQKLFPKTSGFPSDIYEEIRNASIGVINQFRNIINETINSFSKTLNTLRGEAARQYKGRMLLVEHSALTTSMIENQIRGDSVRLRDFISGIGGLLDDIENEQQEMFKKLEKDESIGNIENVKNDFMEGLGKIKTEINKIYNDLSDELKFLKEIADDDKKLIYQVKKAIELMESRIERIPNLDDITKQRLRREVEYLRNYEQTKLNQVRLQARTEYRQEAKTI